MIYELYDKLSSVPNRSLLLESIRPRGALGGNFGATGISPDALPIRVRVSGTEINSNRLTYPT